MDNKNIKDQIDIKKLSPMMQQYLETKKDYPDCILFYRIGDFYEMFYEDAKVGAKELDLVLTGKDCGIDERAPMCGIPYHAADNYITRLVKKGYKVAIGEQVEDPRLTKGIVKRKVIRVVTPGTLTESDALDTGKNNYLMCVSFLRGIFGISTIDVGTGDFYVTEVNSPPELYNEINRYMPSEMIVNQGFSQGGADTEFIKERWNISFTLVSDDYFDEEGSKNLLKSHFHAETSGLGLADMTAGILACGGVLKYVYDTQFSTVRYITKLSIYSTSEYMILDSATMRNLEITETLRDKEKRGTLLWVLDKTKTAMGSRLMRKIITQPLLSKKEIEKRQETIAEFNDRFIDREELSEYMRSMYDLERLVQRFSLQRANPLDLIAFEGSISMISPIKDLLTSFDSALLKELCDNMDILSDLLVLIRETIKPDAPASVHDGGIILDGFDKEVDHLRELKTNGRKWMLDLENEEREKTGIRSLKVKYNKNFGYCLEVTNSYKDLVPDYFIRKQTLTTGERYTTEKLEELSTDILTADEKLKVLEFDIFSSIVDKVAAETTRIQATSKSLAYLDVLISLSLVAMKNKYVRPGINETGKIVIKDGRHPVVELTLKGGSFIPNDTKLDLHSNRLAIITGPNMAGKSTYLRQVALITLMAQTGSFVPASRADISVCDRIFTRVGASDDLSMGQSTFMVEMTEVANILRNASSKSLLILDEIGRGTSTYDGLSIAWAVVEYIASKSRLGAKTLFATHYHELTELEGKIKGVHNYAVAVREKDDDLIFLRKIIPGGADKSYGIAVAKLAGVPGEVISRAEEISNRLDESDITSRNFDIPPEDFDLKNPDYAKEKNEDFESEYKELKKNILSMDINKITPMEAMFFLNEIQEKIK